MLFLCCSVLYGVLSGLQVFNNQLQKVDEVQHRRKFQLYCCIPAILLCWKMFSAVLLVLQDSRSAYFYAGPHIPGVYTVRISRNTPERNQVQISMYPKSAPGLEN